MPSKVFGAYEGLPLPTEHASGDAIALRDLGDVGAWLGRLGEDVTLVGLVERPPMTARDG
jgi:hypothetical protein